MDYLGLGEGVGESERVVDVLGVQDSPHFRYFSSQLFVVPGRGPRVRRAVVERQFRREPLQERVVQGARDKGKVVSTHGKQLVDQRRV